MVNKKKMKFREKILPSGAKLILGKEEKGNDELMKKFKDKSNIILHTRTPGSPFGVIEKLNPSKEELYLSGAIVLSYSQDWRDNKSDSIVDVFTGKDISKPRGFKPGMWHVKKKKKSIKIKKQDVLNLK